MQEINKNELIVPKGIRYLSNWEDFNFSLFPSKCILDKKIPGCGFTEYCLTGKENVILCSPRKILLENKKDSHGDEVYLVKNELEVTLNYDKNLEKPDKSKIVIRNPTKEETTRVYTRLYNEIESYKYHRFSQGNKPLKILVTYDSFHIVKDILTQLGIFNKFFIVIDEFQSLMFDSKFKSDTEIKFLDQLQSCHSSLFVSATPMMDRYLIDIDEFRNLVYYVLDWGSKDPSRLTKPDINPLTMKSVGTKCEEIVNKYKSGNFESTYITKNGEIQLVESKEAVFYVNSVNHIINVINKCNLQPDEVNILCSDTEYNQKRLKQRLKVSGHTIGRVPLKNETNKMFTFCTRTVYLGADFYSTNARSFVFSDANINTLVVDVSEDLAQILGRQRDKSNPWSNSVNFYYITSSKNNQEELENNLKQKFTATEKLLQAYNQVSEDVKQDLARTYEYVAKTANYRDNYVAVNSGGIPVYNKLAMIAEKRSYEMQKYDYVDRFSMFNKLEQTFGEGSIKKNTELEELREEYSNLTTIPSKLKLLCSVSPDLMYRFINLYIPDFDKVKSMLLILSQKKIIALGYNITKIDKEIRVQRGLQGIKSIIKLNFKEGDHYSCTFLADKLQAIYNEYNIEINAKATDIKMWFETKDLKIQDKTQNKRVRGIKLIKLL